jgi:hypothetical protein
MADKKISALTAATTPLAGTEVLPIVQSASTVKVAVNDMLGVTSWTSPAVNSEGNMFLRATDTLGTGVGTQIGLGGKYNASSYFPFAAVAGRKENATNNNVAGYLSFLTTTSGGTLTERARIDSTGNFVISTAGKGIDFSANTHAAGMTSELLNDYEEGTFTLTDSGVKDAVSGTWTFVSGKYTKIGRQVTINAIFSGTGLGFSANTGYYRWDGLPYAAVEGYSGTWQGQEAFKACAGFAFTAGANIWLHAAITSQTSDSGIVVTATYTV